jgi:uncharacterized membrane protein
MNHDFSGELSTTERLWSAVAGLVLAATAAKPRPNMVLSVLALGTGTALAYRASTGYCPLKAALANQRP